MPDPRANKHWNEVTASRFDHEREALEFLRERLPQHEPWRVWTNFQFMALDGSLNEVDALVLGKAGFFLVEIKGHPGEATGNQDTIAFQDGTGHRKTIEHPIRLTDLKSKRLKELIQRTRPFSRRTPQVPFIEPLVFLSHANSLDLGGAGDMRTFLRDREETSTRKGRKGIVAALVHRDGAGLERRPRDIFDRPLAKRLEQAFDEIGLSRRQSKRLVGDYELGETIEETHVYRDSLATHTILKGSKARARRYFVPPGSELARESIENAARREFQILNRLDHPGILRALSFSLDEQGPVQFFEHIEGAIRLDRYLSEHGGSLDLDRRLNLIRTIAEAVQSAHQRQVVHRCLSPQSILVIPSKGNAIRLHNGLQRPIASVAEMRPLGRTCRVGASDGV